MMAVQYIKKPLQCVAACEGLYLLSWIVHKQVRVHSLIQLPQGCFDCQMLLLG